MTKHDEVGLKNWILNGLRKDEEKVYQELKNLISKTVDDSNVKSILDSISDHLKKAQFKKNERNRLSRQIGIQKKNNLDCAELIAQTSSISSDIKNIENQIDSLILNIEPLISSPRNSEIKSSLPKHLTPSAVDSASLELSIGKELVLSHTEVLDDSDWSSFVDSIDHATVYHDIGWQQIIQSNFSHKTYQISCRDHAEKLIGVLMITHMSSRIFGSFTVSMPYFNYGGPLAENSIVEQRLLSYAAELSEDLGCSHMEIRDTCPRDNWRSTKRKVTMILSLPGSDDELDSMLGSKLRSQVKKARENNINVIFGGTELLDDFYSVFSQNMRDLGTPVYGIKIFKDILLRYPDSAFISIAYSGSKPLAVGFLIGYRDKLEIPWASSVRGKNHLGANMLMYRSILREAILKRYHFFDFGRSTKNASTYNFKKQWGAIEHQLYWHYWTKNDSDIPEINPDNPKYKIVIMIWRRLPLFLTNLVGPFVSRNLP